LGGTVSPPGGAGRPASGGPGTVLPAGYPLPADAGGVGAMSGGLPVFTPPDWTIPDSDAVALAAANPPPPTWAMASPPRPGRADAGAALSQPTRHARPGADPVAFDPLQGDEPLLGGAGALRTGVK
jgi:hypothetical protein